MTTSLAAAASWRLASSMVVRRGIMNNNTISISYEFLSHLGEADCNSRVHNDLWTLSVFAAFISTVAAANISAHYTTGFKTDKPTILQAIQATDIAALLSTISSSNNAASITTIQATKLFSAI